MEFYSALKRNEGLTQATTWVSLKTCEVALRDRANQATSHTGQAELNSNPRSACRAQDQQVRPRS